MNAMAYKVNDNLTVFSKNQQAELLFGESEERQLCK